MKLRYLTAILLPFLFALNVSADELPELGDISQATISPRQERQLGLQIMAEIRADRSYLDDPEIAAYLTGLGNRLLGGSNEDHPDQEFEFLRFRTLPSTHLRYLVVLWVSTAASFSPHRASQSWPA